MEQIQTTSGDNGRERSTSTVVPLKRTAGQCEHPDGIALAFNGYYDLFVTWPATIGYRGSTSNFKLQIMVRRHASDNASVAYILVYNQRDRKWNHLANLLPSEMVCIQSMVDVSNEDSAKIENFEEDEQALLGLAQKILSVGGA